MTQLAWTCGSASWAGGLLVAAAVITGSGNPNGTAAGRESVYASGWSAAHADASNSDYSPVSGANDLTLAWSRLSA